MKQKIWLVRLSQRRFVIALLIVFQLAFMTYTIFSNSLQSEILRNALRLVSLLVALHVMTSRTKGAYKNSLIFLILIFPVFGGFFYLFFKWQTGLRKLHKSICKVQNESREYFFLGDVARENAIAAAPEHENQIKYLD